MNPTTVKRRPWIVAVVLLLTQSAARGDEPTSSAKLDLLIVAPHSDDEAIGCATVIMRAVADKKRPGVVVLTAGDGFPKAAAAVAKKPIDQLTADDFLALAALRQRHSAEAMRRLGVREQDLFFLGYPDGGLAAVYDAAVDSPYRQPFTGRTETYGPVVANYHQRVHGRPARYVRDSVVGDLAAIIRTGQPQAIYVTNQEDEHPDHRFAARYVVDAVRASRYQGALWGYVVHGATTSLPPDLRLTLTKRELELKRALLESYEVGVSPVHDSLAETYARPEELFWKISVPRGATK